MSTPNTPNTAAAPAQTNDAQQAPATKSDVPYVQDQRNHPAFRKAAATKAAENVSKGPAQEQPKQPTAAEIRKLKLVLDGQNVELSEPEVIKLAQMSGASQKRFFEAAQLKKNADERRNQVEEVLQYMKSNPLDVLKKIMDPKSFRIALENELVEQVRRDSESPTERQAREQAAKLRAYEQRDALERAERAKRAEEAKNAQIIQRYDGIFTKALEESGVPKTPYTIARMAQLQRISLKKNYDLDASQLASLVREDYAKEIRAHLGGMDGDRLLEFLGEEIGKNFARAKIKKLKSANAQKFSTPQSESTKSARRDDGKPRTWTELRRKTSRMHVK